MPQGQTLDQIFSATQTPTKVSTASGSLSSGTMQTLDQAFGSVKSSAPVDSMATHNFLDSAFNPKPTTPISTSPFDMSGDIAANTPEADAARASTGIHIGPTVMQGVNDAGNAVSYFIDPFAVANVGDHTPLVSLATKTTALEKTLLPVYAGQLIKVNVALPDIVNFCTAPTDKSMLAVDDTPLAL